MLINLKSIYPVHKWKCDYQVLLATKTILFYQYYRKLQIIRGEKVSRYSQINRWYHETFLMIACAIGRAMQNNHPTTNVFQQIKV